MLKGLFSCINIHSYTYSRFIAFGFLQHLKVIANEGELNAGDIDVQDWKSLRKLQVC